MRTLYDVPAPAKLNLFLHITGRRSDGYHLLQSVFMLIDWQDQLHFERTASPTISRSDSASTTALPTRRFVRARRPRLAKRPPAAPKAHTLAWKNPFPRRPAWAAAPPTLPPPCWP